jgi:hypothetical protein
MCWSGVASVLHGEQTLTPSQRKGELEKNRRKIPLFGFRESGGEGGGGGEVHTLSLFFLVTSSRAPLCACPPAPSPSCDGETPSGGIPSEERRSEGKEGEEEDEEEDEARRTRPAPLLCPPPPPVLPLSRCARAGAWTRCAWTLCPVLVAMRRCWPCAEVRLRGARPRRRRGASSRSLGGRCTGRAVWPW